MAPRHQIPSYAAAYWVRVSDVVEAIASESLTWTSTSLDFWLDSRLTEVAFFHHDFSG